MTMQDKKPTYIEGVGWRYETDHTMTRRMEEHDYQSRCIYMITITTEGRSTILGTLQWTHGDPKSAHVERTPIGDEVAKCWDMIPSFYEGVKVFPLMVMPDHVHGILFVTKAMECHLGQIIKGFKTGCNKALRRLTASQGDAAETTHQSVSHETLSTHPSMFHETLSRDTTTCSPSPSLKKNRHPDHGMLFSPGYQDSILMGKGQLDRMFSYIADNPYRLAVKHENPDLFRIVSKLKVEDMQFAAIGNKWLLDRPLKMQVRCHNNTTPENLRLIERQKAYFLERGRKGGVVVSPCISAGEKEVARAALDAGIPLVVILENGFPPIYKPPGKYFEACAKGLLLMLAPWEYHMEHRTITRAQCIALNDMAYRLSTEPWTRELEERLKNA